MSGQHYALRMDVSESEAEKPRLSDWLSANGTAFLVVFEQAPNENDHIHAVFYSDKKLDALRKSFKRAFTEKAGNGGYSLKKCDDDVEAYMRYMCKGPDADTQPEVWCRQGLEYAPEKVVSAHEAYWVNAEALRSNKRKRAKLGTIVEELEALCKHKGVTKGDKVGIAREYIRFYRDARKGINVFHARSVVNTVALLLDDTGKFEEELANQIAY